jgi:alpha-L-rhamnosidase
MGIGVVKTKVEYMENPIGIDATQPRLSWMMQAGSRGAVQTAYQVVASSTQMMLHNDIVDLWDSGKVNSSESLNVPYRGAKPLNSGQRIWWKVRVWDGNGQMSEWSDAAYWTMGLLQESDWKAEWIGRTKQEGVEWLPPAYLRKEMQVNKSIRQAVLYASALGLYTLLINGEKVTQDVLTPGWTDYNTRVQYQTYDVTDMLRTGDNAIGAILGSGWYCGQVGQIDKNIYGDNPFVLVQLHIDYEDGTSEIIVTDRSWRTSRGPILYSDMIMGEAYDARLELGAWAEPGYNEQDWEHPIVKEAYTGKLTAQVDPPIRVTQRLVPVSVKKSGADSYIFDFGQNMVGWASVRAEGSSGQKIKVNHGEMLDADGSLYTANLRNACQEIWYTLKGEGVEQFEPHFSFQGFRYVEVMGLGYVPTLDAVIGEVVHSLIAPSGLLETSDAMLNKLHDNIVWGQRGNFISVPTDCPQRDEKLGWTGDAQIFSRTACYLADVARFFTKYTIDMIDAQLPTGAFTDTAPDGGWYNYRMTKTQWLAPDNAAWGDAGVIIPWTVYQVYGDTRILETSYEAMVRWIEYCKSTTTGLLRPDYSNYGDWLSINADTPKDVLATAYFAYSTRLMSKIADVLARTSDAEKYNALFEDIRSAFCDAYIDSDGVIKGGTQTAYVLAIQFELLPDELLEKAAAHLVHDIRDRDNHLTTGFLGVGYLLPALTACNQVDISYDLLRQHTFPSWLYSVKHGATTIWECWDGWTEHKGFRKPTMNSFNHYSLGSVGEWMYRHIGGIDTAADGAGFKKMIIKPLPGGGLTYAKARYESGYGTIRSEWQVVRRTFLLQVEIPVNTQAVVILPNQESHTVGSGLYQFECKLEA